MPTAKKRRSGKSRTSPRKRGRSAKGFLVASAALVALALGLTLVLSLVKPGSSPSPSPLPQAAPTEAQPETRPEASASPPLALTPVPEPGPMANPDLEAPDLEALAREAENLGIAGQKRLASQKKDLAVHPATARPERQRPRRAAKPGPRLIFVIDDAGHNMEQLEAFLKLPFPLTIAVLPGLPNSRRAAEAVKAAGKELILHQPMEALGGQDPGPGAVFLHMKPSEAAALVEANLDSLPGALGMNNHEGSAVSRDPDLMGAVMGVAKRRGIYYLDSLTVSDTSTRVVASREGILHWERDVFLDNSPDKVSIIHYLDVGKKKAEKNGAAIMIGHVWSADLAQTLSELYPSLIAEGFSLSTISKVMLEEADASSGD